MTKTMVTLLSQCSFATMVLKDAAQRNIEDDFLRMYYDDAARNLWEATRHELIEQGGKDIGGYNGVEVKDEGHATRIV